MSMKVMLPSPLTSALSVATAHCAAASADATFDDCVAFEQDSPADKLIEITNNLITMP